jgi:hypothetical protein
MRLAYTDNSKGNLTAVDIAPMTIDVPQDVLDDLQDRLRRTRWPVEVPEGSWTRGVDLRHMKELVEYWLDEYDWREQEAKLNELSHFKADVDGLGVHFIRAVHERPEEMANDLREFFRPLRNAEL